MVRPEHAWIARLVAGRAAEGRRNPNAGYRRFELGGGLPREKLSPRRPADELCALQAWIDRRHTWPPGTSFCEWPDAAGDFDFAGCLRQPGQPVCRSRSGPIQRGGAAAGAWIQPQPHPAPTHDGSSDRLVDRRSSRADGWNSASALVEYLAAGA